MEICHLDLVTCHLFHIFPIPFRWPSGEKLRSSLLGAAFFLDQEDLTQKIVEGTEKYTLTSKENKEEHTKRLETFETLEKTLMFEVVII